MTFKHYIVATLCCLFLPWQVIGQCTADNTFITMKYQSTILEVCIPTYSVIRNCLAYWTPTYVQRYGTPAQFECTRCRVYANSEFIVSLTTLSTSSKYYLSCIPISLKTINCDYYIQKVLEDRTSTFECGSCPAIYPALVKGVTNHFSFCTNKPVANCLSYGTAGLDRIGFTKVRCESCEAKFALDFTTNKCLYMIENCGLYDEARKCRICNKGFQLMNQQCIKPDSSPLIPGKINIIPNTISPCLQFSRRSQEICMKCKENYKLWNGQCLICPSGSYINSRGECVEGDFLNCAMFGNQGLCLYCKDGYKFNSILTACLSITPPNKCPDSTTRVNYVEINGVCVAVDVNCRQRSYGINGCFECKIGFYNWEGVCYFYL